MPRKPDRRSTRSIVGRQTLELRRRVGEEVRRLRLDAGVSQRTLSSAAGVDHAYLSQIERAVREPSLAVLEALSTALGADLSVRLYPNTGPAIHDRTQTTILQTLLSALGPSWARFVEVASTDRLAALSTRWSWTDPRMLPSPLRWSHGSTEWSRKSAGPRKRPSHCRRPRCGATRQPSRRHTFPAFLC
jgi:transcriptional regulator with XRE-family HTH domain